MNIIRNFLINIIVFFKNILKEGDHTIISTELEYWVDNDKEYTIDKDNVFWKEQSKEWTDDTESYYVSLKNNEKIPTPPENVTKVLMRVKYWFNNRVYKFLTYNHEYDWPPKYNKNMSINIPLLSAKLLNENGTPVKDLYAKIKRYAGPYYDFYGDQKIKISDMLFYDEDTLKNTFPKILIRDIFGRVKTVSTVDGYITDLRVP